MLCSPMDYESICQPEKTSEKITSRNLRSLFFSLYYPFFPQSKLPAPIKESFGIQLCLRKSVIFLQETNAPCQLFLCPCFLHQIFFVSFFPFKYFLWFTFGVVGTWSTSLWFSGKQFCATECEKVLHVVLRNVF